MIELPSPDPALRITLSATADAAARDRIDRGIEDYNNATSPAHLAARAPGAVLPLDILVHDMDGRLLGGLIADTFWNWMEVHDLWLEEGWRRGGLGRTLLAAAETEALARGAAHVHLKTFSFQALDFYRKQGYAVIGALEDYPPGETFYWLRKDLV